MEDVLGKMEIYIPADKLKDNYIYEVNGRNFSFAVWKEKHRKFFGIRSKFGSRYIDYEKHWDDDETHGTVKPIREIRKLSFNYCPSCGWEDDKKLMKELEETYKENAGAEQV